MTHPRSRSGQRGGFVLLVVIVGLSVAAILVFSVAKLAIAERRLLRTQQWQAQAAWLAESAIERAAARLAADPKYSGETWRISAEELSSTDSGAVTIRIERAKDQPEQTILVEANYPDDPQHRVQYSKQITMQLPKEQNHVR